MYALVGEAGEGATVVGFGNGDDIDCDPNIPIGMARNKYKISCHIVEITKKENIIQL